MPTWPISPANIRPSFTPLPPMYTWPVALKRAIMFIATGACLGIYLLLLATLLGASFLWFF